MTCRTESKNIGDHQYSVTQWPAEQAMLNKLKLMKTFGASISILASVFSKKDETNSEERQAEALAKAFESLFNNNSPEEVTALIFDFVTGVGCDERKLTRSTVTEIFSGDSLFEIYQVFIFVLQVNYGNLMKGQLIDGLLAKMKESK